MAAPITYQPAVVAGNNLMACPFWFLHNFIVVAFEYVTLIFPFFVWISDSSFFIDARTFVCVDTGCAVETFGFSTITSGSAYIAAILTLVEKEVALVTATFAVAEFEGRSTEFSGSVISRWQSCHTDCRSGNTLTALFVIEFNQLLVTATLLLADFLGDPDAMFARPHVALITCVALIGWTRGHEDALRRGGKVRPQCCSRVVRLLSGSFIRRKHCRGFH